MQVGFAAARESWGGGERAEEGPGGIPAPLRGWGARGVVCPQ